MHPINRFVIEPRIFNFLKRILLCTALWVLTSCAAQSSKSSAPSLQSDGVLIPLRDGLLKLEVCNDDIIRVAFAKDGAFFAHKSLAAGDREHRAGHWSFHASANTATLCTSKLHCRVDLITGAVSFLDTSDHTILAEESAGRSLAPAIVQDEKAFHVRQQWQSNSDESLYGLGQNQLGLLDLKGHDLDLWQHNTSVAVPFLASSRGYGIFWDNTSFTRFGDLRPFLPIPAAQLFDSRGKLGGFTASYYSGAHFDHLLATRLDPRIDIAIPGDIQSSNRLIHPLLPESGDISVRWEGELQPATSGDYQFRTFSNSGIKLYLNDKLVIDHWRQGWLPACDTAKIRLASGHRVKLRLEWSKDQGMETVQLLWKTPSDGDATSLWSEVADGVDYYFIYGPSLDRVIAGYRELTGPAPMMPRWALGLWQCRQRYKTQQESTDIVRGYRDRRIPLDNIVQDWFYWKADGWGSHEFDPERFPDPDGWVRAIHDLHAHLMISVWGKFYPGTDNFAAMNSAGYLYQPNLRENLKDWLGYPYTFYDAFNPAARKLFWDQINARLFSKGIDAWWMDASEPDLMPTPTLEGQFTHMNPTALGSGSRALNAWSLVNSQGIYQGQRQAAPDQRVFILTRSGFAGQQRYAAATWSGDITSTWTALRKQIPAGLGFSLSGIPWWTTDSGGFAVPPRFSRKDPSPQDVDEWRELNARWFQFATFCPILRVHGEFPNREMWEFGGESSPAYQAQLKFDRLRYRLLPYIYSLCAAVTRDNATILRPLVMDFPDDKTARDAVDQFMFGPAILVNPITTYKARSRKIYLPTGARPDFRTRQSIPGKEISEPDPLISSRPDFRTGKSIPEIRGSGSLIPTTWYDFWTGRSFSGGQSIDAPAPFDAIPLHIRAGSIIPFGPDLQYTSEKPADPITLFIYTGENAAFKLYEDDGVTYACEHGQSSTIPLNWNDATNTLTIAARQGSFPGMIARRTFQIIKISRQKPVPFSFDPIPDRTVTYDGTAQHIRVD
jgi:alpha-D-xyloside xylohydrolase